MYYYQFHVGDYIAHTSHLTPLEDLVYRRLLDLCYMREKPLPPETQSVSRLIRLGSEEETKAVQTVLNEFFVLTEKGWTNARVEVEINKANHRSDVARKNGKAGGRPRKTQQEPSGFQKKTQREPSGNPVESYPIPNTQDPIPNTPPRPQGGVAAAFERFWSAYPKKIGKGQAEKAFVKARLNGSLPAVLQALEDQKRSEQWQKENGQFVPNPATWLNQRRWEDELTPSQASATPSLPGVGKCIN